MKTKNIGIIIVIFFIVFAIAFFINQKEITKKKNILDIKEKYTDRKDLPIFDGSFEEYEETKLMFASSRKVILFFNASWCPTCSEFVDEVRRVEIPDNVLILSVDYDTNPGLKQKYKITYQHTFIEVNEKGEELYRWSGGGLERLKKELKIE